MMPLRTDINEAVRLFRPVFRSLRMRDLVGVKAQVPLRNFQLLINSFGNNNGLDNWYVRVQPMDVEKRTDGLMCAFALVDHGTDTHGWLFIDKSLYETLNKTPIEVEKSLIDIKSSGGHEFVHFIAWVYALTLDTTIEWKDRIKKIHQSKFQAWTYKEGGNKRREHLTKGRLSEIEADGHYRVRHENDHPPDNEFDYAKLYLRLLFSREMFEEEFFTPQKRREILSIGTEEEQRDQIKQGAYDLAKKKSVPELTAIHRLSEWIDDYFKQA